MIVSSSVSSKDSFLEISRVEHREALENVLDLLVCQAIQTSLVGRGIELRHTALLAHPGLIADMQVHKLNVDVNLKQDVAKHDQVHLLLASRDIAILTDQDTVPNGVLDHVVRIDNFHVLPHLLLSMEELIVISFIFRVLTANLVECPVIAKHVLTQILDDEHAITKVLGQLSCPHRRDLLVINLLIEPGQ